MSQILPGTLNGTPWRKNLSVIFTTELIFLLAFSAVIPFMPLFIQDLGTPTIGRPFTNEEAASWAGIASAVGSAAMFLSAPIWGMIADRWGRKNMLLRAMIGNAVVTALMGLSPNIYIFVLLRFIQGLLSGTITAASSLVAATTPRERVPASLGLLMVAMYVGNSVGLVVGGYFPGWMGSYQTPFYIVAAILALMSVIVLVMVQEKFQPPERGHAPSFTSIAKLASSRQVLPILAASCLLYIATNMSGPVITLFFKQLGEGMPDFKPSEYAGFAFFFISVFASISSIVAGKMSKRFSLITILIWSSLGTALLTLPAALSQNVMQLLIFVSLSGLLQGALITGSSSVLGTTIPISQQGMAFGLNQSASSLGNGIGALIGGWLGAMIGLNFPFYIAAVFFVFTGLMYVVALKMANKPLTPQSR
uniref:Multidrug resistance protein MdtG n=1 Tax=uncultured Dehalococcoidia bacterium TaxID=498747 RepID=A0A871XYK4_9CHLR|nr:Multidrug resistance protein MdtG [uncultured Dehalococcoidia bacterium]